MKVLQVKTPRTTGLPVEILSLQAPDDPKGGNYGVRCVQHRSAIHLTRTQGEAYKAAITPSMWCKRCERALHKKLTA